MHRKKILIISMTAGSGHVMAAKSILDYALSNVNDAKIEHLDFSKLVSPLERIISRRLYEFLSRKMPKLWGWYYEATNSKGFIFFISDKLVRLQFLSQKNIIKFLLKKAPDVIIFTNPVPATLMAKKISEISSKKIKIALVITDYSVHRVYDIPYIDYYFVGCGEVKYDLVKMGVNNDKIFVSGIPINPRFYMSQDILKIKSKYKLNNKLRTILFIASTLPESTVMSDIKILMEFKENFNIIIITGGNKKLYDKIKKDFSGSNFLLINWTDVIDEYMKISDIIMSKPGGLVLSECMSINKKIFLVGFIPGVERYNTEYMKKNKFAEIVLNEKELSGRLSEIILSKNIAVVENLIYKENPAKKILEQISADI